MPENKVLLVNTEPEPVTEGQAQRVLRMIDLQPGTLRAASAAPQREQGGKLFQLGETASIKGCTFEVVHLEGALMVLKYKGLSDKQKKKQIQATRGVRGKGGRK